MASISQAVSSLFLKEFVGAFNGSTRVPIETNGAGTKGV